MRYIAKIHVLDVMDKVVVSGYVYDADPISDPDTRCSSSPTRHRERASTSLSHGS